MKLARTLTFATLGAGSISALIMLAQGCSSSSSEPTESQDSGTDGSHPGSGSHPTSGSGSSSGSGSTSGSGSSSGSGSYVSIVPPLPTGPATTGMTAHNFAVRDLYLGDSVPWDTTFTPSPANAPGWAEIGFNLDGLDTTSESATNTCTPFTKNKGVVDGNGGIDNAFGEFVVSTLDEVEMGLSQIVSDDIQKGSFTLLFDITGLTGATQTNTGLTGQLFAGANYGGTPPLTGSGFSLTDNWPVSSALLKDGATIDGGSKVSFSSAYVTNGTWVSGACIGSAQSSGNCNLDVSLSFAGYALALTIHDATASFIYTVDAAGQGHATHGVIAGVLLASEFQTAINEVAGQIMGGSFCSTVESLINPVIQESLDMIIDPTTGVVSNTAGTACNGISIGIGFDGDEIAPPSKVAPPADAGASLPPCGSSGSGSSSSSGSGSSSSSGSGSSSSSGSGSSSGAG